jgi:hypothetical protein
MDETRLFDMVFDPDAKPLTHLGGDPEGPAGLADTKYGSGFAIDLDAAALDPQHSRRGAARLRARTRWYASRKSSGKKATAR